MTAPWIDLASRRLGGLVVAASDEWFGPKESLLDTGPPTFEATAYGTRGKVMDGWETRRHSPTGDDWAIIRLGAPGVVRDALVDTTYFRGNAPVRCALDGCAADGHPSADDLRNAEWVPLLPPSPVEPDKPNRYAVDPGPRVTHVRLTIVPDGGVARLRLLGEVVDDLRVAVDRHDTLDLAAARHGARVVAASEEFFSPAHNLLMVGDARDMRDGWETRRRRHGDGEPQRAGGRGYEGEGERQRAGGRGYEGEGERQRAGGRGYDWVVVRLATTGLVDRVEVHTTHFLGNHPQACRIEACDAPDAQGAPADDAPWDELAGRTPLGPHARHVIDVAEPRQASHLRLRIYPDGGVARFRAYGRVTADGWRRAGVRWLDTALPAAATDALTHCCASSRWVARMVARRPFGTFAALVESADEVWASLDEHDWREAFAAHPRIGDRSGPTHTRREQASTASTDPATLQALADGNRAYEQRFGYVFLIRASGRSADEMLEALRTRSANDPATELRVAAEQQRQITRLRLDAMMRPTRSP